MSSTIKVLAIGDIVGEPGREILKEKLPGFLEKQRIDFCVANAENSAGGSGVTPQIMEELISYGVNALTSGDHIWKRKEIVPVIAKDARLLRPANYPPQSAGHGHYLYDDAKGRKIGVINLQGRVFMPPIDSPFDAVDRAIKELSDKTKIIIIDFHAEATSEKIALGWHLDGKVSFIFGTHTHIQTADEGVLPNGTAYITDIGMTGPYDSILGRKKEKVLSAFLTGMPTHFDVAEDDVRIGGAIVSIDSSTGRAKAIERIMVYDNKS
ncbi:MAG: TIGR00282 family metallophosphoesterase [Planctomycetes bacterium]|nr:TIGR00282 family metallophosphoesterase [Planctomycetota bacterium]